MNTQEKQIILKVCKDVRVTLCDNYADGNYKDGLDAMCWDSSVLLQDELDKNKIFCELVEGYIKGCGLHFWLEYKNWIIDLTCAQFNRFKRKKFPLILFAPKNKYKMFKGIVFDEIRNKS